MTGRKTVGNTWEPAHPMPIGVFAPSRRRLLATIGLASLVAGCAGGLDGLVGPGSDAPPPNTAAGDVIGNGSVKVGLILPLSSTNGQAAALSLRNAAQMAISDFSGGQSNIQLLVRDDKGTPDGARQAAQELLGEGVELIIGPLFAPSVQAVASVARPAGKPVIAFSSDAAAAQRGVYLLSFLPQSDVQRVVAFAGSRGKRSFSALIPQTPYGNVVEAEFQQVANQGGRRVATVARYQPGNKASIDAAVAQVKQAQSSADTLFIGEGADGIGALTQSMAAAGLTGRDLQIISTGIWNDPRVHGIGALDGAWFAAPDNGRFNALAGRYQSQFGSAPTRIATLGYDAVTLASALTQNFGTQRFSEATLTNGNGFSGQDGVFRFRQNGLNDRGLVIYEIRSGSARAIAQAPGSFVGVN
ncbi:MAG: penicillin-binding protein activator [Beijerinckiaceae bacterium]|nr:penicillin-binding protein activator [Beijerinckiaceae bacterium]MCZ8299353.1 penicillin-binding protein activator [Beijerinckiaceae bacterium]